MTVDRYVDHPVTTSSFTNGDFTFSFSHYFFLHRAALAQWDSGTWQGRTGGAMAGPRTEPQGSGKEPRLPNPQRRIRKRPNREDAAPAAVVRN